jgi:hypothetical protein
MTRIEMKESYLPTLLQMRMVVGFLGEKDIDSTDTLKAIAAAYLSAFTRDAKSYPYLVG